MVTGYRIFKPTESLRAIQNLFATPKYTELEIGMRAYIKLMSYCYLAGEQEITGIGRIRDGEIIDFKIPYQIVSGTTADASDEDIINLMREIPLDEMPEWELDWHSHCNMQTFISATDEDNYELMSMAKGGKQFPILVVNKRGDVCCKQFIHAGKTPTINFKLIKEELSNAEIEEIYNQCKREVEEKLSLKPIKTYTTNKYSNGKYKLSSGYNSKKNKFSLSEDTVEYYGNGRCCACGAELITGREIDNGLCEDCLEGWE